MGGITSMLQGGKFGHGFVAAGLAPIAGNYLEGAKWISNAGEKFLAKVVVGGTISERTGGKFANGAKAAAFLVALQGLPALYKKTVGYELDMGPGGAAVEKGPTGLPVEGANNVGTQDVWEFDDNGQRIVGSFEEGGSLSNTLNQVPGINAVAGAHDVMQVSLGTGLARDVLNVPGMIPAAAFTYTAALARPLTYLSTGQIIGIATTYSRNKERARDRQLPYIVGY
jgi:hypothetical protein